MTVEDWLANAYEGMSRRQFLARMSAAGVTLAGFASAANSVAGEVITTPADGLAAADGKVPSGISRSDLRSTPGRNGKISGGAGHPEVFGMHEHIKDVTRRFAREGFLGITFEPYAREGGALHLPDIAAVRKVVDPVPDARVMGDLDALVAYVKKHPAARFDRIGVTGFCRGGMYTFSSLPIAARRRPRSPGTASSSLPNPRRSNGRADRPCGSDHRAGAGPLRGRGSGNSRG